MRVKRTEIILKADCRRVILKSFAVSNDDRIRKIIDRILSLTDNEAVKLYQNVLAEFKDRHADIEDFFRMRFAEMKRFIPADRSCGEVRALLIGAHFTHEYSIEAAALFNPAIVWHSDQSGLPAGSKRFILSLRATGEGHISSLTFRTGIIDKESKIAMDEPGSRLTTGQILPETVYERSIFEDQAKKSGLHNEQSKEILARLNERFSGSELAAIVKTMNEPQSKYNDAMEPLLALCPDEYQLTFNSGNEISERVIFPVTASESNGIEDARFARFEDGPAVSYFATYTAYDGHHIRVKLLETNDFLNFKSSLLYGPAVNNKGIALFPKKINGKYAMLARQDNESNFIMFSDDLYYWRDKTIIQSPVYPWEFIQLGNCGSPLETDAGWLVFSHGVGAMRKYSIGAFLLDRDDPTKLIGRTTDPLLAPNMTEREGYVPNVVYSCGAIIHGSEVILPYAMSDSATSIARIDLNDLLRSMKNGT